MAKESSPNTSYPSHQDYPHHSRLNRNNSFSELPKPSTDALVHSEKLLKLIVETIENKVDRFISFAEYMQLALFAPGLGYYSAGNQKFGMSGDFVTAPEISPLYSQCIAKQCKQVLDVLGADGCILEIGAGSGQMAVDILKALKALGRLPKKYYILELSAELKERQQKTLLKQCPELFPLVFWLDALPEKPLKAIILANEVCDAMPVHRFCLRKLELAKDTKNTAETHSEFSNTLDDHQAVMEVGVTYADGKLCFTERLPEKVLDDGLALLMKDLAQLAQTETLDQHESIQSLNKNNLNIFDPNLNYLFTETNQYHSEINLNIKPWIKSLSEILDVGIILIIDYGFPRQEYYHPSRSMGTIMCHYRHHAHGDPFSYPGLQDITAHVDFTSIGEAASNANLEVLGFTNQTAFLLNTGLLSAAEEAKQKGMSEQDFFKQNQAIQILTSPAEMGELFKVIALGKSFEESLLGFTLNDMRYRL